MMTKKVILQPIEDDQFQHPNELRFNTRLFRLLKLKLHQTATLQCSNKEVVVECMPLEGDYDANIIQFSKTLAEQLALPIASIPLKIFYDIENSEFRLGPIIAILTKIDPSSTPNSLFGPISNFCDEMAQYAHEQHTLLYVFSLKYWNKEKITGYIRSNDGWIETTVPLPEVIYNRVGSRKLERSKRYQQFFDECKSLNISYFNDHFLNKWEVFEALLPFEELTPHIPETTLLKSIDSLEEMLQKHSTLFLKPIHGSQGKGIFRITKQNDLYQVDYSTLTGDAIRTFPSIQKLYNHLRHRFQKQQFLIQQGLTLMDLDECALDFRVLCARDKHGDWKAVSCIARVSAKEKIVSNLAQGGELLKVEEALSPIFDSTSIKQYKKFLQELALEISRLVSQEMEGNYGELGVDIGLDQSGHPWFIEVNTKPSKNQDPDREQIKVRPSAKAIIAFGHYLADFQM